MPTLILAAVLLFSPFSASTQRSIPNLKLRLVPREPVNGVPDGFTFKLVNISNHNLRVPQPIVDCAGDYTGYIWLRIVFTPPHAPGSELGYGCGADKVDWPPILKRAQEWKLLRPGDAVSQTVTRAQLHYEGQQPGTYEFWAEYHPPAVEPDDQKRLRKKGIDFPHTQLTSSHLTFTRKP
jgi:hypothetical protein